MSSTVASPLNELDTVATSLEALSPKALKSFPLEAAFPGTAYVTPPTAEELNPLETRAASLM